MLCLDIYSHTGSFEVPLPKQPGTHTECWSSSCFFGRQKLKSKGLLLSPFKNPGEGQAEWHIPLISALRRQEQGQVDLCDFEASLGYKTSSRPVQDFIVKSCLQINE